MPRDLEVAFIEGDDVAWTQLSAAAVVVLAVDGDGVAGEVSFLLASLTHDAEELEKLSQGDVLGFDCDDFLIFHIRKGAFLPVIIVYYYVVKNGRTFPTTFR